LAEAVRMGGCTDVARSSLRSLRSRSPPWLRCSRSRSPRPFGRRRRRHRGPGSCARPPRGRSRGVRARRGRRRCRPSPPRPRRSRPRPIPCAPPRSSAPCSEVRLALHGVPAAFRGDRPSPCRHYVGVVRAAARPWDARAPARARDRGPFSARRSSRRWPTVFSWGARRGSEDCHSSSGDRESDSEPLSCRSASWR